MNTDKIKAMGRGAFGAGLALAAGAVCAQEPACAMTGLQKAAGYVTFANSVKFLSASGAALFLGVFLWQLRSVFKAVPLAAWKALGYATVATLCASGAWMDAGSARYLQFAGAVLGCGAWAILLGDLADALGWKKDGSAVLTGGAALLCSAFALATGNELAGGVAVAAFMGFIGFGLMSPAAWMGADDGARMALDRSALGACATLGAAAAWKISQGSMGAMEVFWPGVAWVATLAAGLSLLALSMRWFDNQGAGAYALRNLAFAAFAGAALWAGSHEGMGDVSKVAGTCALLWILAKPWDIPKKGMLAYSFFGATTCAAVFEIARQAANHPELWGKFLMF